MNGETASGQARGVRWTFLPDCGVVLVSLDDVRALLRAHESASPPLAALDRLALDVAAERHRRRQQEPKT